LRNTPQEGQNPWIPAAEQSMLRPKASSGGHYAAWLHRLDSYTNAEYGRPLSLSTDDGQCVACGGTAIGPGLEGVCRACAAKRKPDSTEVLLFRPMNRRDATDPP
jgi:hypothetical protein